MKPPWSLSMCDLSPVTHICTVDMHRWCWGDIFSVTSLCRKTFWNIYSKSYANHFRWSITGCFVMIKYAFRKIDFPRGHVVQIEQLAIFSLSLKRNAPAGLWLFFFEIKLNLQPTIIPTIIPMELTWGCTPETNTKTHGDYLGKPTKKQQQNSSLGLSFWGSHGLLPWCHQFHAVHPALSSSSLASTAPGGRTWKCWTVTWKRLPMFSYQSFHTSKFMLSF